MEKIIEIQLKNVEDLYSKYNKKHLSKELTSYLIESTPKFTKKDKIKIIIDSDLEDSCIPFIIGGLKKEYNLSLIRNEKTNLTQITYFLIGVIILFIYTLINDSIFKEVLLIGAWFLIGRIVEIELLYDSNSRKKRRILKKLINSEFVEIKK